MPRIQITDLTLRDAHQSLFATRMLTADMLPIADKLDRVGFWSLETWGGATFDTCIRFLNEDPWERLRRLETALPHSRQQMLLRGQNLLGYRHYADDVVEAFVAEAARVGVDVFRIFDALNDTRNLETAMRAVKKTGKHAQAAISYAVTPVHTVERYVELALAMAKLGADSICIKDMAGLLTPRDAYALTKAIKKDVHLPLQIHSHATTGMSVAAQLKAVEAGADLLDTTISSMAMGTSHSPTETVVEMLRGSAWDTGLDMSLLVEIAAYFREVRRKYKSFESAFVGADTRILVSQVPGGMLSNLESQLREQGAADKMDAVLEEIAVVQKDFGYPPLVTPTSQIVGTQAVMNVLFGRYKKLSNESRNLLVGQYGATPVPPNDALVRQALQEGNISAAIQSRPADHLPAEMTRLESELKSKTGAAQVSREDVLTYAMFPQVALAFFQKRAQGPVTFDAPAAESGTPARSVSLSGRYRVTVDGQDFQVASRDAGGHAVVTVDGEEFKIALAAEPGASAPAAVAAGTPTTPAAAAVPPVLAPMPGTIVKLACAEGSAVAANQTVVIIEALKMQMDIKSSGAGRVKYRVKPGDNVKAQSVLADIV